MPEYLAPGVYVEETSFRSKSIEGVSTTTTGFVGPTRYGPTDDTPEILTSLTDYERTYGDGRPLQFIAEDAEIKTKGAIDDQPLVELPNDMWSAVRAFFDNGGARLYVKRIYRPLAIGDKPDAGKADARALYAGSATATIGAKGGADPDKEAGIVVSARYPGVAGARRVRVTLERSQNRLRVSEGANGKVFELMGVQDRDVVLLRKGPQGAAASFAFALATATAGQNEETVWTLTSGIAGDSTIAGLGDGLSALGEQGEVYVITAAITDLPPGEPESLPVAGLPLDPQHRRDRSHDSLFDVFNPTPLRASDRLDLAVTIALADAEADLDKVNGLAVMRRLLRESATRTDPLGRSPRPICRTPARAGSR